MDKQRLVCLSYGVLVPDEVAESLLSIEEMGVKQHEDSVKPKLSSTN